VQQELQELVVLPVQLVSPVQPVQLVSPVQPVQLAQQAQLVLPVQLESEFGF